MTFIYIVRCNFSDPSKEQAWNDWYSGPKIGQMLRKPHFLTCQRFRRASGHGRDYLALWTLSSPDAFKTRQYTTDWGFFEWEPHITDWSRDLFDGRAARERDYAVAPDGALQVVAFDGLSAEAAEAACEAMAASIPEMRWLPVIGLDRHTPLIGLWPRRDGGPPPVDVSAAGVQKSLYRPISAFHTAGESAA